MTRLSRRSLVALAATAAFGACFSVEMGSYENGAEVPRTPEGVARAFQLEGVPWAPIPVAKYAGGLVDRIYVADDAAYCVTDARTVYVVGLVDGAPRWTLDLPEMPEYDNGFAWGPTNVGFVTKNRATIVNKRSGARLFSGNLQFTPSSAGIVSDDSFYSGSWGSGYALRSATLVDGWSGWSHVVEDAITAKPVLLGVGGADRSIVFASHDGNVISIEPRPARGGAAPANWAVRTTGKNVVDLATDGHTVFVACSDGVLYGISSAAGATRWKWFNDGGAALGVAPTAANSLVYQPLPNSVVVIDGATGVEKYRVAGAARYLTRIGERDFYAMKDRTVGAIDVASGAVVAMVHSELFEMLPANPTGGTLLFSDGKTIFAVR